MVVTIVMATIGEVFMTTSQEIHVEAPIEAEAEIEVIPKILAMDATNARVEFARALVIRIVIYMSHAA